MERDAISVVLGVTFDLINDRHHLLLAGGTLVFANSVGPHTPLTRGASIEQYWLGDPSLTTTEEPSVELDWIYEGCDDVKKCFGVPVGCLETRNCDLFGGVFYDQGRFEFELLSSRNYEHFDLFCQQIMKENFSIGNFCCLWIVSITRNARNQCA